MLIVQFIKQNLKKANLDFNKVIFIEQVDKFKKDMVVVIMYFCRTFQNAND